MAVPEKLLLQYPGYSSLSTSLVIPQEWQAHFTKRCESATKRTAIELSITGLLISQTRSKLSSMQRSKEK